MRINYHPGIINKNVDALSCSPHEPGPLAMVEDEGEVKISFEFISSPLNRQLNHY